jgi:hypothetical protein
LLFNTPIENTIPASAPYAYLANWSNAEDAAFLAELLKGGVLVKTSNTPFEMDKTSYPAGTLIITRKGNEDIPFDKVVTSLANKHFVQLTPVKTGFVSTGPDFGNDHVVALKAPKSGCIGWRWRFPARIWRYLALF